MAKQKKKETKIVEELNERMETGFENNEAEIQNEDNADVNIEKTEEETEEETEEVPTPIQDMSLVDATVIPAKLNMRRKPNMLAGVIAILTRGDHVTIDLTASEINGFVPAKSGDLDGYVKKEFLNY